MYLRHEILARGGRTWKNRDSVSFILKLANDFVCTGAVSKGVADEKVESFTHGLFTAQ
jgi:hypothetical protein